MRLYSIDLYHLCRVRTNKIKNKQLFNKQDENLTIFNDFLFVHNKKYLFSVKSQFIPNCTKLFIAMAAA